jgi:hypothetical protein
MEGYQVNSEIYKTWRGKSTSSCNVDSVIDALKHIRDRRARAWAEDCLETAPEWALKTISKLVKELGLEKEFSEVISKGGGGGL